MVSLIVFISLFSLSISSSADVGATPTHSKSHPRHPIATINCGTLLILAPFHRTAEQSLLHNPAILTILIPGLPRISDSLTIATPPHDRRPSARPPGNPKQIPE